MAVLTLTFLGSFQAAIDDVPIARFRSDKVRALLAYLALEAERPHSRASLCGLLWPDQSDEAALHNLSQTLLRLREALGDPRSAAAFLRISRQAIQWNAASDHYLDTTDFARLASSTDASDLEQAAALYHGEFLAGFSLAGCAAFEEWLLLTRECFAHLALAALDTLTRAQLASGRYVDAAQHARRQLALDPWREDAHRQLMQALAASGDRAAALAAYERCRQLLRDDLGVEPDDATHALYEQIRTNELKTENEALRKASTPHSQFSILNSQFRDWSEVPEPGRVYGRAQELAQLQRWLIDERCQVIALLGIGGVGKTTLAAAVAQAVDDQFERVIWRSLLNAPLFEELLPRIVQTLSRAPVTELPASPDDQLALLLEQLRQQRCLLILDNLEGVLQAEGLGRMRAGYEGYAHLLDRLAHSRHQSCLLLTSRERSQDMARWEVDLSSVRALRLEGLDMAAGQAMLNARGLMGQEEDARALIARYSGHPLALTLVAQTVQELFGGVISDFLHAEAPIFDDIRAVLDQQFARLSEVEQDILVWLAIEREAIAAARLQANLVHPRAPQIFLEAVRALQRRSLLEKTDGGFTLQNVVIEYLTERLIEAVCAELLHEDKETRRQEDKENRTHSLSLSPPLPVSLSLLNRFALLKAQARGSVRQSQVRLIVQPIVGRVTAQLGRTGLVECLTHILASLREAAHGRSAPVPGYAAGNVLNLLLHLGVDISGYDFSHLCVWQAYLRGIYVPKLNLAGADLAGSVFTHLFEHIQELQFRANGELIGIGFSDGMACLWRVTDGALLHAVAMPDPTYSVVCLCPDSRIAALVGADHTISFVDIPGRRVLHRLAGHHSPIWKLIFSPDGQQAASGDTSGQVCVWAVESGRLLQRLQMENNPITALAFTPDSVTLACGAVDGTVCLWDLARDVLLRTWQAHTEEVAVLAFVRGGVVLATGSHDHTVRLWEVASGAAIDVLRGHAQPVRSMASDSAGRLLATGGGDAFIALWDVESGEMLHTLAEHASPILQLAGSPDGQLVAASDLNETISVWDVPSGQRLDFYRMHRSAVYAVAFSRDGRRMVSGGTDWAVYVWDASAPADTHVTARLPGHQHRIKAIAFGADDTTIASGDVSGAVFVWDIRSRARRALNEQQGAIMALAFSPDGRTLASAGADGTICLWDVLRDRPRCVLRGHTNVVGACAFSPDGRFLASGSMDRTICLWDAASGTLLHTLRRHTNIVHAVVFSPDGRRVISTSYDQTVCLWDAHIGQVQASWPAQPTVYVALAVHPDGDLLAAGGADTIIRLIETGTGRVLREMHGHSHTVESLSFHPAGRLLASASVDETIKLWDIRSRGGPAGAAACLATLRVPGPYAGMNIAGATGISDAQKAALKALGAVEVDAQPNQALDAGRDMTTGRPALRP